MLTVQIKEIIFLSIVKNLVRININLVSNDKNLVSKKL